MLLGLDFFDRYQASINCREKILTVMGKTMLVCVSTQDPSYGTCDLRRIRVGLEEKVKLPPASGTVNAGRLLHNPLRVNSSQCPVEPQRQALMRAVSLAEPMEAEEACSTTSGLRSPHEHAAEPGSMCIECAPLQDISGVSGNQAASGSQSSSQLRPVVPAEPYVLNTTDQWRPGTLGPARCTMTGGAWKQSPAAPMLGSAFAPMPSPSDLTRSVGQSAPGKSLHPRDLVARARGVSADMWTTQLKKAWVVPDITSLQRPLPNDLPAQRGYRRRRDRDD